MQKIDLKFSINDVVQLPLMVHKELYGRVTDIWILATGTKYGVRYYWESKPIDVYFYEDELREAPCAKNS